jgi:putative sigma-54 modulation protein
MGKNKFEGQEYNLSIVGKHVQITDPIRTYVFEKLSKIEKIADRIIDIHVTLDAQKMEQSCAILMNFIHFHIKVSAATDNLYSAIDKASDRAVALVRKYKNKLKSHRFLDRTTVDIHVNVVEPLKDDLKAINDEIVAENAMRKSEDLEMHRIVAKEMMPLKTLTQDEAVMKMEITDAPFMIFKSEEHQKMSVIYRRDDRNYGIVQVQ